MQLITAALSLLFLSAAGAQPPLALPARSLSGKILAVPADLPSQPSILIVGFSRSSQSQTTAWSKRIAEDPKLSESAATFSVAMLENVPSFLRGLVTGSIKKSVPARLQSNFLVVTKNTEAWKQLMACSMPDLAYVALFDARHKVVWRTSGAPTQKALHALQVAIAAAIRNNS